MSQWCRSSDGRKLEQAHRLFHFSTLSINARMRCRAFERQRCKPLLSNQSLHLQPGSPARKPVFDGVHNALLLQSRNETMHLVPIQRV
ncbi:hypothetical protein ANCCEY_11785 [Ancylostoma ceylanicum]|uniref:Uncharacterized protein n=1 Tax=Ancylostoma ceylanicum TaxID=53326 RepID=A0A0D6LCZ2_9BILA|nr:hypothetical protein ANCCEY_11785 [Ancylostoma ceylanicum]